MKTKKIFFEQLQEYREHLVSEEKSTVTIEKYLRDINEPEKSSGNTKCIEVFKIWDDKGEENKRPEKIEIYLLCNKTIYDTQVITHEDDWKYKWKDLPVKDKKGEKIDWTILTIPSLELTLPVMSDWDYEKFKIAPCRYSGSTVTKNLVIAAHNYKSHFGNLRNIRIEDEIMFTDMKDFTRKYIVKEVYVLEPTAVEEMKNSPYELTLFTCTYGGKMRVTVRCEELRVMEEYE